MPKLKVSRPDYRVELYKEKQVKLRTGYGHLPEDLRKVAEDAVNKQTDRWNAGFGIFNTYWKTKVVPILEAHKVPRLSYATYRAFFNALMSKVYLKGTRTKEGLIRDFVEIHQADEGILNEIIDELEKAMG